MDMYGHKHTLILLLCQLITHTYACAGRKLCYGTIEDITDGILRYFKYADFNKEDWLIWEYGN